MTTALGFARLRAMTDVGGLYEHANGTAVRREHGYCVDDVARALIVVTRPADRLAADDDLREQYLAFVLGAQAEDGRFHNRRGTDLRWLDQPSVEDCWGRALWALGVAAAHGHEARLRMAALAAFERGARWTSPWPRAMSYAALGAADVLAAHPENAAARELLEAAAGLVGRPSTDPDWPWPEARLAYANATLPEALLACGHALNAADLVVDGLLLLGWLVDQQTRDGHLSVVPAGGRGPGQLGPGFDQQPIEVAALADACARAHDITGDPRWAEAVELAADWFSGANDTGTVMYDEASAGGCDGLQRAGRNENQGAESTLALLSTWQQARRMALCLT